MRKDCSAQESAKTPVPLDSAKTLDSTGTRVFAHFWGTKVFADSGGTRIFADFQGTRIFADFQGTIESLQTSRALKSL